MLYSLFENHFHYRPCTKKILKRIFYLCDNFMCVFISYFYLKDKICTGYFKQKQTLKIYIYEKGFI